MTLLGGLKHGKGAVSPASRVGGGGFKSHGVRRPRGKIKINENPSAGRAASASAQAGPRPRRRHADFSSEGSRRNHHLIHKTRQAGHRSKTLLPGARDLCITRARNEKNKDQSPNEHLFFEPFFFFFRGKEQPKHPPFSLSIPSRSNPIRAIFSAVKSCLCMPQREKLRCLHRYANCPPRYGGGTQAVLQWGAVATER